MFLAGVGEIHDMCWYGSGSADPCASDKCSVADPGCLSRIPDPKTATTDRGEKKFFVKPFFVATNFTKLNIILFLIC